MHDAIMKIDKRRVLQIVESGSPTAKVQIKLLWMTLNL